MLIQGNFTYDLDNVTVQDLVVVSDKYGYAVAISGDGLIRAVTIPGANTVNIYDRVSTGWQLRDSLTDPTLGLGLSVSLNHTGDTLAIGATDTVLIMRNVNNTWSTEITLAGNNDFGVSCSLSADGNTVAIGANTDTVSGKVILYNINAIGDWVVSSQVTPTKNTAIGFGSAVSLSADATRMTVSSPLDGSGTVTTYTLISNTWTIQYEIIPTITTEFGNSLAVNGTGDRVVVSDVTEQLLYFYNITNGIPILAFSKPISANVTDYHLSLSMSTDGNSLVYGLIDNSVNMVFTLKYFSVKDLQFDPTGISPANLVLDEVHPTTNSAGLIMRSGCFFKHNLVVNGTSITSSRALVYGRDYMLSPPVVSLTNAANAEVFSFIIILRPQAWQYVTVSYQGVGSAINDSTILLECINIVDAMSPSEWGSLTGETAVNSNSTLSPVISGNGVLATLTDKITKLVAIVNTPKPTIDILEVRRILAYAITQDDQLTNSNLVLDNNILLTEGIIAGPNNPLLITLGLKTIDDIQTTDLTTLADSLVNINTDIDTLATGITSDVTLLDTLNLKVLSQTTALSVLGVLVQTYADTLVNGALGVSTALTAIDSLVAKITDVGVQEATQDISLDNANSNLAGDTANIDANSNHNVTIGGTLGTITTRDGVTESAISTMLVHEDQQDLLIAANTAAIVAIIVGGTTVSNDLTARVAAVLTDIGTLGVSITANTDKDVVQDTRLDAARAAITAFIAGALGIGSQLTNVADNATAITTLTGNIQANTDKDLIQDAAIAAQATAISNIVPSNVVVDTSSLTTSISLNTGKITALGDRNVGITTTNQGQNTTLAGLVSRIVALEGNIFYDFGPLIARANANLLASMQQTTFIADVGTVNALQDTRIAAARTTLDALIASAPVSTTTIATQANTNATNLAALRTRVDTVFAKDNTQQTIIDANDAKMAAIIAGGGGSASITINTPASITERTQITASNGVASDQFGSGCALSANGSILAVGAYGVLSSTGAVYIYDWSGTAWVERSQVTASNGVANDEFGSSCALSADGSILAVGAVYQDTLAIDAGMVYVFDWNGTAWIERTQLTASNGVVGDRFGSSCTLSADGAVMAVGAMLQDTVAPDAGMVYVFDWNGTVWTERTQLTASNGVASDLFGYSCTLSGGGSILAVGAITQDTLAIDAGMVYVFDWNGTVWTERTPLTASNGVVGDNFGSGSALSADGSILAVGASGQNSVTNSAGMVYIFDWNGTAWVERTQLTASNGVASDLFGSGCALSADGAILAVGAMLQDTVALDAGMAYVYDVVAASSTTTTPTDLTPFTNRNIAVRKSIDATTPTAANVVTVNTAQDLLISPMSTTIATLTSNAAGIQSCIGLINVSSAPVVSTSGAGTTPTFLSTDFRGASTSDVHVNSSWQIATDPAFTNIIDARLEDTVNLLGYTSGVILVVGSVYYVRAKHVGSISGATAWGAPTEFIVVSASYTKTAHITASNRLRNDGFGNSCALSANGGVLVVGAATSNNKNGRVYIYDWNGTAWVERTQITATPGRSYWRFGSSCALSADGSILAVGSAIPFNGNTGRVYIYDWNGTAWVERSQVIDSSGLTIDYFGAGCSLSADGSILAVLGNVIVNADNVVITFDWNGTTWVRRTQTIPLLRHIVHVWDLGCSLSSDGNILAVSSGVSSTVGAVYIFDWNGTTWVERAHLTDSRGLDDHTYGNSCALSADGSILAVGVSGADFLNGVYGFSRGGLIIIYDWNGTAWVERTQFTATPGSSYWQFGSSCALSADGSILAVGATEADNYTGVADTYDMLAGSVGGSVPLPTTSYMETLSLVDAGGATNNNYGYSMAVSQNGLVLVVGSPTKTYTSSNTGSLMIYDWNGTAWVYRLTMASVDFPSNAGVNVGWTCTLSGDGSKLAAGRLSNDYVALFNSSGSTFSLDQLFGAPAGALYYGEGVALSSDGTKLVVSARGSDTVYLYDILTTGTSNLIQTITGPTNTDFGKSVAFSTGDILAIGASSAPSDTDATRRACGKVHIYSGTWGSYTEQTTIQPSGVLDGERFGFSVTLSNLGAKLMVGTPYNDKLGVDMGAVYIYNKGTGVTYTYLETILPSVSTTTDSDHFGSAVSVTGDGVNLLIGASRTSGAALQQGKVYLYN